MIRFKNLNKHLKLKFGIQAKISPSDCEQIS